MNHEPVFSFALSPEGPALTPKSDLWGASVPGSRHDVGRSQAAGAPDGSMTYGDYFTAARHFLSRDRCAHLCDAAGKMTGRPVTPEDLRRVSVYLVKYGAFYHPAYVTAEVGESRFSFVLNVGVSSKGRRMIAREHQCLTHLHDRFGPSYWPRAFGFGAGLDADGRPIPMFLGQWLEGYHEFHLSGVSPECRHVVVWDTARGHLRLSHDQVLSCLRRAASVLTHAYNPLTFDAIRRWHPAAGDFVVALKEDDISVRMVAVRDYAPMIANREPDVAAMLEGLLLFLMEISLKLRLDRLDGIGRVVCHGRRVVPAICDGFFQGVSAIAPAYGLPGDFDTTVREFIALHDAEQLRSVAVSILRNTSAAAGEQELLQRKMEGHLSAFLRAVLA
jgi:hypothetical protein